MEDACYRCVNNCPGDIYCKPYKYKFFKQYESDVLDHEKPKKVEQTKTIKFTAIIKDGGYETFQITSEMFSKVVLSIQEKGYESLHLKDRSVVIVGVMLLGKEVGDRIIVCGNNYEGGFNTGL